MLHKTTTGNPTNNLILSKSLHDRTPDRQSVPTLSPSDIHKWKKLPQLTLTDQIHMWTALHTIQLQISNKLNKS